MERRHQVFWDADCGFCRRGIEWFSARDHMGVLEPAPFQAVPDPPMTPELRSACEKALHVLTADGRLLRGGAACLFLLEKVGPCRSLAALVARSPLVGLVELAYRWVAGNRRMLSRLLLRRPWGH